MKLTSDPENFKTDQYEERAATLIGWGSKEITGGTSSTLKRTILTIYEYRYSIHSHICKLNRKNA